MARSGREAGINVGIVRGIGLELLFVDAPNSKIVERKQHRGVGLKLPALGFEAVEINPRDARLVLVAVGFFFYDGGQGVNFFGVQCQFSGQLSKSHRVLINDKPQI